LSFAKFDPLAFDVQDAAALDDDVDLVVCVRLLTVGLRCDQDVDAELEPRRLVNDSVAMYTRAREGPRRGFCRSQVRAL
jgi:hypothetical protein